MREMRAEDNNSVVFFSSPPNINLLFPQVNNHFMQIYGIITTCLVSLMRLMIDWVLKILLNH